MSHNRQNGSSADDNKTGEAALEDFWNNLLALSNDAIKLAKIFARAEKLAQYYCEQHPDTHELRREIEIRLRMATAEVAAGATDPHLDRLRAALAGAQAGCLYPLGWSPRDLNSMSF